MTGEHATLIMVALITALPGLLAAIASVLNLHKTHQIHETTVNGNATQVRAELTLANQQIAELRAIIAKHEQR